jgi:hypothetical protein
LSNGNGNDGLMAMMEQWWSNDGDGNDGAMVMIVERW